MGTRKDLSNVKPVEATVLANLGESKLYLVAYGDSPKFGRVAVVSLDEPRDPRSWLALEQFARFTTIEDDQWNEEVLAAVKKELGRE